MDFSEKVRYVRGKLNISQEDLARSLNVSYATVNRWENSNIKPIKMAQAVFNDFCETHGISFSEIEARYNMTDNKKEQERAELHRIIWNIANGLRGSVDGWDFKQYVLGMLFYRYISENIATFINDGERKAGIASFDYTTLADKKAEEGRDDLVKTKGFFILPSELLKMFENALFPMII